MTCGKAWTCPTCKAVFSAKENLQTHCRRKGHQLSWDSCKKLPSLTLSSSPPPQPQEPEVPPTALTFCKQEPSESVGRSKYVKIAPMPSLTMTAALALSELSTMEPLASFSTTSKNQQQSIMVGNRDKLVWSAASTQTSPRGEHQFPPAVVSEISEESIFKEAAETAAAASAVVRSTIPKLGEIEQFSTETQTDDLELLLKPSSTGCATATSTSNAGQNEDAFTIEAQTQFDLDDILCSNYTQTALFDTSLDPTNSGVNSAETQTMLMSYDLVNMETQTMSMLDF